MKLVVVGGGIAGLAATRAARRDAPDAEVTVLEAADRLGGKIRTELVGGAALEWGPDSFLASKPWARDLAADLGLDLVPMQPAAARAFLLLDGRLRRLPAGLAMGVPTRIGTLLGAVREGIVGPAGAGRAWADRVLPAEPDGAMEPSVAEMARRRLGRTWADRVIAPLIGAVFGAPPHEIGFAHAYPGAVGARSLIGAARRRSEAPGPPGPAFLSIRGGMGRLVEALAADLADSHVLLRTGCPASSLREDGGRLVVETPEGDRPADALVLAVPAPAAARLIEGVASQASLHLADIRYSASAVVLLGYEPGSLGRPLDGSGYLVAPQEHAVVAACSWLPVKWPHAAAPDRVWLRAVVTNPVALRLPDHELKGRVRGEVDAAMGTRGPAADVLLHRWDRALPIFGLGHAARIAAILRSLPSKIAVAGAYLDGLGVPDCIRTGQEAARRVVRTG
jgi:oxygen-dependent protoporphyrinogen oxidase